MEFSIKRFGRLRSTQDWLKRRMATAPEGTVCVARCQTQGRGQRDHRWDSAVGGLYFSLMAKPRYDIVPRLPAVPPFVAAGLAQVMRDRFTVPATLKWPNDILIGGKKVAGILCETQFLGASLQGLIIGVGVNFENQVKPATHRESQAKGYGVTALPLIMSLEVALDLFLVAIDKVLHEFAGSSLGDYPRLFASFAQLEGSRRFRLADGETLKGRFLGFTSGPEVRILGEDGCERQVVVGEVLDP